MNIRNTVLMFCLSLGVLWVFGIMLAYKRTPLDETLIMPTLKSVPDAAIDSMTIEIKEGDKKQKLQFIQTAAGWTFGDKIRVESARLTNILNEVKSAAKNDEEKVPSLQDSGVNNPRIVLTMKAKAPKELAWELKVGRTTNDKNFMYVATSDRPGQVMAVSLEAIKTLFFTADIDQFRSRTPFEFTDTKVKQVLLAKGDMKLELKKNDEDQWKIVQPPLGYADLEGVKPKSPPPPKFPKPDEPKEEEETKATGGVRLLIAKLKELRIQDGDFVPATANFNLKDNGLEDGSERYRFEVNADGKDEVLLIGNESEKDKYFARLKGDLGVFRLSGKQLEPIFSALKNPKELRSKDVLFFKDTKAIDLVRLTTAGKVEYYLAHPDGKGWSLLMGRTTAKASSDAVDALIKALDGKREILEFADGKSDKDLGLDKFAFGVALYENAKPKEEKKPAKDEIKKDDKDKKEEAKFVIDTEPLVLEKKDDTTEATFKNGKPKTVTPADDKTIKAEIVGERVKFTQLAEPDTVDRSVDFVVKGGKEDKEEVKITVTMRKKPGVTLFFGKDVKKIDGKDALPVKRVMDGTESLFYLPKEIVDKVIPGDVYLAYLDTALPKFEPEDLASLSIDHGKGKEPVNLERVSGQTWIFKGPSILPSENLAETNKVMNVLGELTGLKAKKWLQKIDKTDLASFGLNPPALTVTFVVKKLQPAAVASAVALLGSGTGFDQVLAEAQMLAGWALEPGQTVTVRFGKETDNDKDRPGTFALFTVGQGKEAKKEVTNDLLFLVSPALVKAISTAEFHDRSTVLEQQKKVDAGSVGLALGTGPWGLLAQAPAWDLTRGRALLCPPMLTFDPAKVEKITLETRGRERRKFVFNREKPKEAKVEKKDDKDKKDDKARTEPSLKGTTWNADDSGLSEFKLDSEKVNEVVEQLAKLSAVGLASATDGPRAYQKLGPKEAIVRIEIFLEGQTVPITLSVGADIGPGRFAHVSTWPQAVFIMNPEQVVREVLRGTNFFGKDREEGVGIDN